MSKYKCSPTQSGRNFFASILLLFLATFSMSRSLEAFALLSRQSVSDRRPRGKMIYTNLPEFPPSNFFSPLLLRSCSSHTFRQKALRVRGEKHNKSVSEVVSSLSINGDWWALWRAFQLPQQSSRQCLFPSRTTKDDTRDIIGKIGNNQKIVNLNLRRLCAGGGRIYWNCHKRAVLEAENIYLRKHKSRLKNIITIYLRLELERSGGCA